MKRIFLYFTLVFVGINAVQAQADWRRGKWYKDIPENFLTIDLGGSYVITTNFKDMNPFAVSAQVGYQHKVRPFVKNRLSFGFGGNIGYSYYPANEIKALTADIKIGDYKSFHYIPIMLNATLYFNMRTSYIYFGIDAGISLMLCERDFQDNYNTFLIDTMGIEIPVPHAATYFADAKEDNPLALTHVIPTAKAYFGFMKELNENWRLRISAGVQYTMGYDLSYKQVLYDGTRHDVEKSVIKTKDCIDPFLNIGIVYSL
ncbi:MAG: hypothetical protein LBL74_04610 [Bacteroidales bacterium]|nr:hypothetical protein [Bacteroidales bacterium]